jgi:hypothetical protein
MFKKSIRKNEIMKMEKEILDINEILSEITETVSELIELMSAIDKDKINTIPYEGSWTAPQLLTHVTKSINGMSRSLQMDAKPAERDPGERIELLKKIFLDFSKKLQSPEFIVPETGIYERQPTINKLNEAFNQFKEKANIAKLDDLVEGLPLGPITKWEIIHFTLYHTKRHLHQMRKIYEALKEK